ncbi:hypothetical protein STEG23_006626, partial [Scotinomys teguina]
MLWKGEHQDSATFKTLHHKKGLNFGIGQLFGVLFPGESSSPALCIPYCCGSLSGLNSAMDINVYPSCSMTTYTDVALTAAQTWTSCGPKRWC